MAGYAPGTQGYEEQSERKFRHRAQRAQNLSDLLIGMGMVAQQLGHLRRSREAELGTQEFGRQAQQIGTGYEGQQRQQFAGPSEGEMGVPPGDPQAREQAGPSMQEMQGGGATAQEERTPSSMLETLGRTFGFSPYKAQMSGEQQYQLAQLRQNAAAGGADAMAKQHKMRMDEGALGLRAEEVGTEGEVKRHRMGLDEKEFGLKQREAVNKEALDTFKANREAELQSQNLRNLEQTYIAGEEKRPLELQRLRAEIATEQAKPGLAAEEHAMKMRQGEADIQAKGWDIAEANEKLATNYEGRVAQMHGVRSRTAGLTSPDEKLTSLLAYAEIGGKRDMADRINKVMTGTTAQKTALVKELMGGMDTDMKRFADLANTYRSRAATQADRIGLFGNTNDVDTHMPAGTDVDQETTARKQFVQMAKAIPVDPTTGQPDQAEMQWWNTLMFDNTMSFTEKLELAREHWMAQQTPGITEWAQRGMQWPGR